SGEEYGPARSRVGAVVGFSVNGLSADLGRHVPPEVGRRPRNRQPTNGAGCGASGAATRACASLTRPIAVSIARILLSVSAHSFSGTESITIPAAAWTFATPSAITHVRIVIARSIRAPPAAMYPTAPPYAPRRSGSIS